MCKRKIQMNDAEVCLETISPSTEVWTFRLDVSGSVSYAGKDPIEPIPTTGEYTGGCHGDSGAPLWLEGTGILPETIAAVYRGSDNIVAPVVCGQGWGVADKLTHPTINKWIEDYKE